MKESKGKKKPAGGLRPGAVWGVLTGLVVSAAVWAGVSYYGYAFRGAVLRDGGFYLPTGSSVSEGGRLLAEGGFVRDSAAFVRRARRADFDTLRPGHYVLDRSMSWKELVRTLGKGYQTPVRVTFHNIRTFERLAAVVSRYLEADSAAFLAAFRNDSLARAHGFTPEAFIGMFVPDTYEFYWNTPPEGFIDRMHKEYDRFWERSGRSEKLRAAGLTRNEAVTLASIVIEETKRRDEMPVVAGVYVNRLKKGMPLQADPTVKFAVGDFGLRRVLNKHLRAESPYNTYLHAGLPPGPICIPEPAAVDAVLDHGKHGYYYFCASPQLNGTHVFSRTLAEHDRAAAAYRRALDRRGIR